MASNGFALWDVLGSCERKGSLNNDIKKEQPNPLREFCQDHPTINRIIMTGGAKQCEFLNKYFAEWWLSGELKPGNNELSRKAFEKNFSTETDGFKNGRIEVYCMPGVSPAAASISFEVKRDAYREFCYNPGLSDHKKLNKNTQGDTNIASSTNDDNDDDVQLISGSTRSSGFSRVKLEMFNKATSRRVSANYKERQTRMKERMLAMKAPNGGPRKVFRRGSHNQSICQVLGGGILAAPIVKKNRNPFIKKGEIYFAGKSDWNPWTPAYPGDVGFVESLWVSSDKFGNVDRSKQECFHCFLDCAKKKHLPHYLGPEAEGKRLYLCRYRVVPDDVDEVNVVEKVFMYEALEWDSKITLAEWRVRHGDKAIEWHDSDGNPKDLTTTLAMDEYQQPAKIKAENEQKGLWESLPLKKRQERA